MVVAEVSLVPPARLASLLSTTRSEAGLDLVALAQRSNGAFSPTDLEAFERGRRPLDELTIATLADLYQLDAGPIVPGRNELVLDLVDQNMSVGEWWTSFDSPLVDDVLERYVALVHLMRGHAGTQAITLRTGDLEVLSQSLAEPPSSIRVRIEKLLESQRLPSRRSVLQSMTAVAGAGILVGVTVVGAVVLVNSPRNPAAASADQVSTAPLTLAASAPLAPVELVAAVPELSERAEAIEALVGWDFRAALPGWTVEHAGPHVQWRGVTNSQERIVTLFDRPTATPEESAAILAHELGHALDLEFLDDDLRIEWLSMRSETAPWWAGDGQSDFAVGAGDFAEAVAGVLMGTPTRSEFGPLSAEQLAFVRDLLPLD